MPKLLFVFFLAVTASTALGSRVLIVTSSQKMVGISNGEDHDWEINQNFCLFRSEKEIACGKVVKIKEKVAFGRVDRRTERIQKGDTADYMETGSKTSENRFFIRSEINPHEWFNVADITISSHWQGIGLNIQQSILPNFSMSIMPTMLLRQKVGNGELDGVALYLGINYYSNYLYSGFWGQVGVGFSLFNAYVGGSSERKTTPLAHLTAGWRWRFGSGFNFGVAGGVQYFLLTSMDNFDFGFSGFLPVAILDVGWIF